MKNKMIFTRIAKFKFNEKTFQMYKNEKGKIAFLEYAEDGKYHYPTYADFCKLVSFFLLKKQDNISNFENKSHKKYRFNPKLRTKIYTIMITSSILLSGLTGCANVEAEYYMDYVPNEYNFDLDGDVEHTEYSEQDIDLVNDNQDFYSTDDYEIIKSAKYVQLYNNKYFGELFDVENYTVAEVHNAIEDNNNINESLKIHIHDFVDEMSDFYPNLDFRIFYHNIKSMRIELWGSDDIAMETGGLAFYDQEQNLLVVSNEADLSTSARAILIFRHELAHAFNNAKLVCDGYEIKYTFNDGNRGMYVKEGLDVLFSSYPFLDEYGEEELDNLGYSITTNIIRVITDCLPNYKIEESVTNNIYHFQNQMNEYMPDDIEASIIVELLELQWQEYSTDMIEVDEEEYRDLYGYVARMYIKTYINKTMTYEEIMNLERKLEEILVSGVKDESYVYTDVIEEEFLKFIEINNINSDVFTK